ncbi:MAG: hypothetical protein KDA96_23715 [Planctomycetaceae bacterium]|nr:hypothetical protein [Planctomycetaceae bacterium]
MRLSLAASLLAMSVAVGCAITPPPPRVMGSFQVAAQHRDVVWEQAVEVLNQYHFLVARESKLEGLIETEYRAGANVLEPWHPDAPNFESRMESSLQSIRRRAIVSIQSSEPGLLKVAVRVEKEIEDVPGLAANYEGGATFSDSQPLQRDLTQVLGQSGPSQWLPLGRDLELESQILGSIRARLGR